MLDIMRKMLVSPCKMSATPLNVCQAPKPRLLLVSGLNLLVFFFMPFMFFRTVVNGILAQVGSNLKTSCEVTNDAFNKRISEVKHAKVEMEWEFGN